MIPVGFRTPRQPDAGHHRGHDQRKDHEGANERLPGNEPRTSTQASGNPGTNETAAAVVATSSESRSAVNAVSLVGLDDPRPRRCGL